MLKKPSEQSKIAFLLLIAPTIAYAHRMPSGAFLLGALVFSLFLLWLLWYLVVYAIKKISLRKSQSSLIKLPNNQISSSLNALRHLNSFLSFALVIYIFFVLAEVQWVATPTPWDRVPWDQFLPMLAFWVRIGMYILTSLGLAVTARGLQLQSLKWGYFAGMALSALCLLNFLLVWLAYEGGINAFFLIYGLFLFIFLRINKASFLSE